MKAVLYTLLVLLILGSVCVATCPDREAHSEALKGLVNQVVTSELSGEEEDAGLVMFGSVIGTGLGGLVIDNMLNIEDSKTLSYRSAETFQLCHSNVESLV